MRWNVFEPNKGFEERLSLVFISVKKQQYKDPKRGLTILFLTLRLIVIEFDFRDFFPDR